jgi:Uma2 family endonuclease
MRTPFAPPLTYEEFSRMPDDGKRYELIEGELVEMSAPFRRHQELLGRLYVVFREALGGHGKVYFAPLDIILSPITALQPDLTVVLPGNEGVLQDWIRGAPDLVVEILSRSTAAHDRIRKLPLYARYGVRECWLLDDPKQLLEAYRLAPDASEYHLAATFRPGDRATTPLIPDLILDLTALLAD